MIAVSGRLVWRRTGWSKQLISYAVQLVLAAALNAAIWWLNR